MVGVFFLYPKCSTLCSIIPLPRSLSLWCLFNSHNIRSLLHRKIYQKSWLQFYSNCFFKLNYKNMSSIYRIWSTFFCFLLTTISFIVYITFLLLFFSFFKKKTFTNKPIPFHHFHRRLYQTKDQVIWSNPCLKRI